MNPYIATDEVLDVREAIRKVDDQHGVSLLARTEEQPCLLVFLRHQGCTFCREALADITDQRAEIERTGARIVLIHMGQHEHGEEMLDRHGLGGVLHASDPERGLYQAFGLPRGSLAQVLGPKVWLRGLKAGLLDRHGIGRTVGDGFQMPGVFLVSRGKILSRFRHQRISDRPDYVAVARGLEKAGRFTESGTFVPGPLASSTGAE